MLDEIEPALPNEDNRSIVLFTSRAGDVAFKANHFNYHLDLLDQENSWVLLSKIALLGGHLHNHQQNQQQPPPLPVLEELGRQLADKCSGLPSAIVFLGHILRSQPKTEEAWKELVNDADRLIKRNVLSVYHNCPLHLRLCFLYLGMFPEKQTISARQLIQVWMAEGLINFDEEADGDNYNYNDAVATTTMEDKGREFLEELIDGNYVKADAWRAVDGAVKKLTVPRLFRDFCVYRGAEHNFFQLFPNAGQFPTPTPTKLAVYGKQLDQDLWWEAPHIITNWDSSPHDHVRSLHYFLSDATSSSTPSASHSNAAAAASIIKLTKLRVLNLGGVRLDRVPDSVGSLIHLRYLRINAPTLRLIPPSICKIPNLQTLDMRETVSCAVPDGIWKMRSLRHLYFGSSHAQLAAAGGSRSLFLDQLQKLQTLSGIQPNRALKRLMVRAKFPNVSKLRLRSADKGETLEFLNSLDHLYHLQNLRLMNPSTLPDAHAFPGTLAKMTLWKTALDKDGVQKLETLPNLRVLKLLEDAISEETFGCGEGGFPQLQVLHLVGLRATQWSNGRGGMRSLQRLVIKDCHLLAAIPQPEDLRLSFMELTASCLIPRDTIQRFQRRGSKIQILEHPPAV